MSIAQCIQTENLLHFEIYFIHFHSLLNTIKFHKILTPAKLQSSIWMQQEISVLNRFILMILNHWYGIYLIKFEQFQKLYSEE